MRISIDTIRSDPFQWLPQIYWPGWRRWRAYYVSLLWGRTIFAVDRSCRHFSLQFTVRDREGDF